MPRIRRWHPVSHDLNGDAEVWELTDRFGDRAIRVWLEILSITDRTQGMLKGEREYIESTLGARCRMARKSIRGILNYALDKHWLLSDGTLRTRNYSEFHRTKEQKKSLKETQEAPSEPSRPSDPSEPELQKDLTVLSGEVSPDVPDVSSNGLPTAREIQEAWNAVCGKPNGPLDRVVKLTETRRRKIRVRCGDLNALHKWEVLFKRILASPFLRGEKGTWKASLDWLIENDTNWVKVMEGKYVESAPR